jgi:hypothetical protein
VNDQSSLSIRTVFKHTEFGGDINRATSSTHNKEPVTNVCLEKEKQKDYALVSFGVHLRRKYGLSFALTRSA